MSDAKQHYINNYHTQIKLSDNNFFMYGYIKALRVNSVFEFGCNAGRHLNYLHHVCGMEVMGIDVNEQAIKSGQQLFDLPIEVGDEMALETFKEDSFDLCLCNSVLSHIKKVDTIIEELQSIARKYVLICETQVKKGDTWFIHDYEGFDPIVSFYAEQVNAVYRLMLWSATK